MIKLYLLDIYSYKCIKYMWLTPPHPRLSRVVSRPLNPEGCTQFNRSIVLH